MRCTNKLLSIFMVFWIIIGTTATGSETGETDKTLSPYFHVISDDPGVDQLPLKSTSAQVSIAGVISDVKVTQVYKNEGKKALEAIYVFPASTRASVYGMKMTIGERTIVAKVREREIARQEYEQAKQEGKTASLLEQQRPNVFQMNVANILPGDVIRVELSYTELLVPTDGVYEFVYPTVVGPRYSEVPEAGAPSSEGWVKNPTLHEGEAPTYMFDIAVNISGSMMIQEVTCASHKVNIDFQGPSLASVKLDPSEKSAGNKDYILRYRLSGGKIDSGLLLYEGEDENFFLLMVQPPERVTAAQIPPREYVFIVDISGSMRGFPLDISKKLLSDLIGNLRAEDKFNVLLFAAGSELLWKQSRSANAGNIRDAIYFMDNKRGGGGTQLLPAMNRALGLKGTEAYSRSVIVVTDGYVRVEKEAFDLIRNRLGEANMFAFGIGSSVNRFLIEGMSRVGMGEPFVITKPQEASDEAEKFRRYIQSPVLTHVGVDFGRFDVYDVEPPAIPDVLAERPVIIFGKWKNRPEGKIRLTGISGDQEYVQSADVSEIRPLDTNSALPYLWARHRIALLSDYGMIQQNDSKIKEEVTQLGLKYNLLTKYTSFVAIDSMVRNKDGKSTTVKQPLPLPEGVSDSAVGRSRGMSKGMGLVRSGTRAFAPSMEMAQKKVVMKEKAPQLAEKKSESREIMVKGIVRDIPDKTSIIGTISKQDIQQVLKQHLGEIETCFRGLLNKNPSAKGNAVIKVTLDGSGQVAAVEFLSRELGNEELKECITKYVKGWKFPVPSDGKTASVEYSVVFE
ncbi:VIT domain-containing protein [Desulfococcaceae bacterium HSG8]|nr:VIT domain-containing protein [Desulfococcaceae bacterium HSG8]